MPEKFTSKEFENLTTFHFPVSQPYAYVKALFTNLSEKNPNTYYIDLEESKRCFIGGLHKEYFQHSWRAYDDKISGTIRAKTNSGDESSLEFICIKQPGESNFNGIKFLLDNPDLQEHFSLKIKIIKQIKDNLLKSLNER